MHHVVFGTGAVGTALIDRLAAAGEQVTAANRSGRAKVPDGVPVQAGDASDSEFVAAATAGADVVYQCLNPPYSRWPELFPPMQEALIAGAAAAGAKLVSFENLYMYGPTNGVPLTEDLPYVATDAKGRVRAQMAEDLLAAHAAGRLRATIGRASDYFGPGGLVSHMGERVFYPLLAGKKAQVMGDPDQPHTFSYVPDIAAGLMTLGTREEADGKAWHLPNPDTVTPRRFIEKIGTAAGVDAALSTMPPAMVTVVGWFNKNVREIKDVLYQFEQPFVVDSTAYSAVFGQQATPLEEAIAATVEWYRANPK